MSIEKRQFGAVALITRTFGDITQVYTHPDKGTIETSSGIKDWIIPACHRPNGLVGGGRHEQESVWGCLKREFEEELNASLPDKPIDGTRRLLYPFLVAQWKRCSNDEFAQLQIDLFAVAGLSIAFDALSNELQQRLDQSCGGSWLDIEQLARVFTYPEQGHTAIKKLRIRPQVATAAWLYYLEALNFTDPKQSLIEKVQSMNQCTHRFVVEEHTTGYIINNGAFDKCGVIAVEPNSDAYSFLFSDIDSSSAL